MIKRKDVMVISALRQNSRQTLSTMSKAISVPISTLHDRIRGLRGNTIMKHTAIVDFSEIGFNTRGCMLIKAAKDQKDELRDYLNNCSHVNWLAKVNNGHDFMVELVFKNIKEMEEYIESLESLFTLEQKEVFYIIDDIKRESFLANPKTAKFLIKN